MKIKDILKVIFIALVIIGLVASYVFNGTRTVSTTNKSTANFSGPKEAPSQKGPTEPPPGK